MVCHRRTIDYANDTMPTDVVTNNDINENTRILYSSKHQRYYWDALCEDEAIIFM